jgi:hypothetical protein
MSREPKHRQGDELLPVLPEEVERALAAALRAAWSPTPIDSARNDALIALALEDPLAPPTHEEIVESERLRRALEGDGEHEYAELARALASAGRPAELGRGKNERIVDDLSQDPAPEDRRIEPAPSSTARRGTVIYVAFGAAAAALALAASIALFIGPMRDGASSPVLAARVQELAVSRSTASMFQEKFETAETTERVDRIASARERELRSNRYAMWGVR